MTRGKPDWTVDGRDWPLRETSRFVRAGGIVWHVQDVAAGSEAEAGAPPVFLIHGTGASTHSFRALAPRLAARRRVVMADLPGHGFTETPPSRHLSLSGMTGLLGALLETLEIAPDALIGHSAGAALAVELALTGRARPRAIVALNGAFQPFEGLAAHVFPVLAKVLALNPLTVHFMSRRGDDPDAVARMLAGTGSTLDRQGLDLYRALFRRPGHVSAVLTMMANWNLGAMLDRLGGLDAALTLIVGEGDKAVAPRVARDVARRKPDATVVTLSGLGHLAHEEDPARVAAVIEAALIGATQIDAARTDAADMREP